MNCLGYLYIFNLILNIDNKNKKSKKHGLSGQPGQSYAFGSWVRRINAPPSSFDPLYKVQI